MLIFALLRALLLGLALVHDFKLVAEGHYLVLVLEVKLTTVASTMALLVTKAWSWPQS